MDINDIISSESAEMVQDAINYVKMDTQIDEMEEDVQEVISALAEKNELSEALSDWLTEYVHTLPYSECQKIFFTRLLALKCLENSHTASLEKKLDYEKKLVYAYNDLHQYAAGLAYAKKMLASLEKRGKKKKIKLLKAEVYELLGDCYYSDYNHPENCSAAASYQNYQKAIQIYKAELGAENEKTICAEYGLVIKKLDERDEGKEQIAVLQRHIDLEQRKTEPDTKLIAEKYERIAEFYAFVLKDCEKAIQYYDFYLQASIKEYGLKGEFVADCYQDLSEFCSANHQWEKALEYCKKALDSALYPNENTKSLFSSMKHFITGLFGRDEKEGENSLGDVNWLAGIYAKTAECYIELGKGTEALSYIEKGLELLEQNDEQPSSEKAEFHELAGLVYSRMEGKEEIARKEYEQALSIYEETLEQEKEQHNLALYDGDMVKCSTKIAEIKEKWK